MIAAAFGCNGPHGQGAPAGDGYLDPNQPAGALIQTTQQGRTYFSVNGRSKGIEGHSPFGDAIGQFEFDVEIQ
jgi:hypothetical protein